MIQQLILTSQKVLRTGLRFRLGRAGACPVERLYPGELVLALPSLREIVIVRLFLIRSKLTIRTPKGDKSNNGDQRARQRRQKSNNENGEKSENDSIPDPQIRVAALLDLSPFACVRARLFAVSREQDHCPRLKATDESKQTSVTEEILNVPLALSPVAHPSFLGHKRVEQFLVLRTRP